jgi:quinol monooxygenase YgiN
MIKVAAKCVIKKESIETFKSITSTLIDETRKEDGCISYELFQDNDNEQVFIFVENWGNQEKLNQHINSKHCKELLPEMGKTYELDMELHFMSLVK